MQNIMKIYRFLSLSLSNPSIPSYPSFIISQFHPSFLPEFRISNLSPSPPPFHFIQKKISATPSSICTLSMLSKPITSNEEKENLFSFPERRYFHREGV